MGSCHSSSPRDDKFATLEDSVNVFVLKGELRRCSRNAVKGSTEYLPRPDPKSCNIEDTSSVSGKSEGGTRNEYSAQCVGVNEKDKRKAYYSSLGHSLRRGRLKLKQKRQTEHRSKAISESNRIPTRK